MRRAAPLTILIVIAMLTNITVFGQKNRAIGGGTIVKSPADNVPVKFRNVQAFSDGRGAWLRWSMDLETRNFGFYIYRIDGGQKQLVNNGIVPGSAARIGPGAVMGAEYSYFDVAGGTTTYLVEAHDMDSRVYSSGPVAVTYVSDIKPLAGSSSEFLTAQRSHSNDMIEIDRPGNGTVVQPKMTAKQAKRAMELHSGVVAQDGIKIAIKKDGMYRVSRAQIEAAGFDVNTDPTLWQLHSRGAQHAMNVVGATGDYIEFYGKGIDEIESDTRIYYLIVGTGPGLRMGSRNVLPITALPSANFQHTAIRAPKSVYINTILNGDATNFFGPGIGSVAPTTINFNLKSLDVSNRRNYVTIEFQGFSLTAHQVLVTLNGMTLPAATGSFDTKFSRSYTVSPAFLREGANTLEVKTAAAGDTCLFSSISVDYRRKYIADQNQLLYLNENFREVDVTDFSSENIRIYDMTDDASPVLLNGVTVQQNGPTWSVHIPQYRARVMLGVEDSGLLQPASITPNFASSLATPGHDADLVIISYKDWMIQAEAWANYRRGQGFDVEVVNIEDIYDEFNFGTQANAAITSFLLYAKNNWNTPPQYVLLMGDASYDPRNFEGNGYLDFVPSKIVNTLYTEVPSDDALVDFNHDGLAEISIGRLPGRSGAYMTKALNRVTGFEVPAMQTLSRGAVFASDLPNGFDFEAMSVRLGNWLPPGTPITYINRGQADASSALLTALNDGPYVVNYSGHGTVGVWAVQTFFGNSIVPLLRNNEELSIYTMLTCLNGYFINPTSPVSLAENLVDAEWTDTSGPVPVRHDTGAISVWASTGLTTPDVQEIMATRFYTKLGEGSIPRMGDLVRDAKGVLIGGEDVRNSWVLLGDPMLKVR